LFVVFYKKKSPAVSCDTAVFVNFYIRD